MTPLHTAVLAGDRVMVGLLIERGADVNAVTENGWTALRYATSKGDSRMTTLLISKGARYS